MDPCCCLGFYCRNLEDFRNFLFESDKLMRDPMNLSKTASNQCSRKKYPLFMMMPGTYIDHKIKTNTDLPDIEEWPESPVEKQLKTNNSTLTALKTFPKYFTSAKSKKKLTAKESYEEFEILDIK